MTTAPVLECRDLHKQFGGVPVLRGVSLAMRPGTVTALAGENGAGKSTMMKILAGIVRADAGTVVTPAGDLVQGDPHAARGHGIAIVPQELAAIPEMTVWENLFAGREIRNRWRLLDAGAMVARSREMLDVFGVDIDPRARMGRLPVGIQQIVEIVKNSSRGARVLLLDEPTSAIAEREVERLYEVVRRLREQGVAMLYTTHKMHEMRALADRVVVLRDGELVTDTGIDDITDDGIVTAMVGRELSAMFPERRPPSDDVVLEVRGLQVAGAAGPVDLTVRRGEIVGLAGLVGAGRTELIESVFGVRRSPAGEIRVAGRPVRRGDPGAAIGAGMALVPEDRKGAGAVLSMSILDNGTLPRLGRFSRGGLLRGSARTAEVGEAMSSVRLRSRGLGQSVGTLSGGNQQKVVLARWLTEPVEVLLLDEPTRGIDVGARGEIYRIVRDLADRGMAVVMASSDMPEILGLAHRALVLHDGVVTGELDEDTLAAADAQDRIFRLATGLTPAASVIPEAARGDLPPDPSAALGAGPIQRSEDGAA
ncbi:sugar ABC transporter ATP-binding protein [Pseudonocardia alni]|uniref:sugar ABC transporter ATP-binding protein n=1 Tax=Pseudonocardia alni TaxID=33907 RepID=UPI0033EE3FB3